MRLRVPYHPRAHPARRHSAAGAACSAAVIAVSIAACGSANGPASAGVAGGTASPGPASAARAGAATACAPSGLQVTVDASQAGNAAGSTYYPIDFTNASGARCSLQGYPAAWLGTAAGQRIGDPAARDRTVRSRPVPLAPGATAHAWLQVTDAANYPAKACRPVTARMLLIRAPGAAGANGIRRAFPACAAAMHGHGILSVQPVLPGRGHRGSL